jgi:hypothetical protein
VTARAFSGELLSVALQVLGDDRAVRRTYLLGKLAWDRDD